MPFVKFLYYSLHLLNCQSYGINMFDMTKNENKDSQEPRQKRKYTKRAKMLMRSNNDYIDHDYWPRVYAEAKKRDKLMREKYPERYARVFQTPVIETASPVTTKILTKEQMLERDIANCTIYGITCSRHNMIHVPVDSPLYRKDS